MLKKQGTLLFALMLTLLFGAVFAHQAPAETKAAKEARWEGRVVRMDKAASSLTVRKAGGTQYHADKKVTDIDAGQVKEDDYVICRGTAEKAGEIKATVISKRLSHSTNK